MSINVNYNKRIGYVRYKNGQTNDLCTGNVWFAEIGYTVWKNNVPYDTEPYLVAFCIDKDHMKNMIAYEPDILKNWFVDGVEEIWLDTTYKEGLDLLNFLLKQKHKQRLEMNISVF